MAVTVQQFAAELTSAGCRITWDADFCESQFLARKGRGNRAKAIHCVFYGDTFTFSHAYDGRARLRSMREVRRRLRAGGPQ